MFCRFRIIILVWKRKDRNGDGNIHTNIFSLDYPCHIWLYPIPYSHVIAVDGEYRSSILSSLF